MINLDKDNQRSNIKVAVTKSRFFYNGLAIYTIVYGNDHIAYYLGEHPFNLKGGGLWFFSRSKYFFFASKPSGNFLSRQVVAT